jgi:hypothetical protein
MEGKEGPLPPLPLVLPKVRRLRPILVKRSQLIPVVPFSKQSTSSTKPSPLRRLVT